MTESLTASIDTVAGPVVVGQLEQLADHSSRFKVSQSYLDLGPNRPLFSLAWFDVRGDDLTVARLQKAGDKTGSVRRVPDWFAGLLPEGALRSLVESEMGDGNAGEFDLIKRLGGDLPGAVRLGDGGPTVDVTTGRIHFSLSGVQLKFVAELEADRVTFPASGMGGHYIIKTPSEKYRHLVEMEDLAMKLVAAVGVDCAETSLRPKTDVDGIPPEYLEAGENVLLSKRFDRAGGRRVHMEDFAQIASTIGDLKYTRGSYSIVMKLVDRFSTDRETDLDQVLRRAITNVLVGNGDAHLKNWSFILDQGARRLSPTYDVVPTRAYGDERLGIAMNGRHNIDQVRLEDYLRCASFANVDRDAAVATAKDVVERALATWPTIVASSEFAERYGTAIVRRIDKLPLVDDIRSEPVPVTVNGI